MNEARLRELIAKGEGTEVEFKTAQFELPRDVYKSVCAMLNRQGGHIILGVTNDGVIEGVIPDCVQEIKDAFVSSVNNPQQLNPKYYLSVQDFTLEGKEVLYIYIPESSQVHSYLNKVYDRNEDGDFDITANADLVRNMHIRKQGSFSENRIYPALQLSDFREDLINRSRQLAENHRPGHLWMELNNEALLRSAGLFKKDYTTGKEGYTLAAALLLGNDEVIYNILPHYKTDAILRKINIDRYDDREIIRTNLIESYDQLMAFVAKHLQDKFYLEGTERVSLRDRIFREVVANLLVHREFINEFPARLIIQNDGVHCENWNRPHGSGLLVLDHLSPFQKNPVISGFFREIGRVDELGSGLRNSTKYLNLYSPGNKPKFIEGDIFKIVIPITPIEVIKEVDKGAIEKIIDKTFEGATKNFRKKLTILLEAIVNNEGKRVPDYGKLTGISVSSVERYILKLRKAKIIAFSGKSKKTDGYYISENLNISIGYLKDKMKE
jgi:ATP-dependent DNA helicase RecG